MTATLGKNNPLGIVRDGDTWQNDRGEWLIAVKAGMAPTPDETMLVEDSRHETIVQGDELYCLKCHKRWGKDDLEIPPCD